MNVLVIGSGGREHALAWKIAQSPLVEKVYGAPGNPGIDNLEKGICVSVAADDFDMLAAYIDAQNIGLTVVGPEDPLAKGVVDALSAQGMRVFGPTAAAAQLEASKSFAKDFMTRHTIPTADYGVFDDADEAVAYLRKVGAPVVIKADGLAAGKGVTVAGDLPQAEAAVRAAMENHVFGDAGNRVVIEERLVGEEASILAFCDGTTFMPLASSQDHKPAYDNDKGPNTGGMGAYSPAPVVTKPVMEQISRDILAPCVAGMAKEGMPYKGILYAGLIVTDDGPKVIEFNARFGDPETQAILPRMTTDIVPLFLACCDGKLEQQKIEYSDWPCVTVVMASGGYPGAYKKGMPIEGIDAAEALGDVVVFQAGVKQERGDLYTAGGRVLNVTAMAPDLPAAIEKAYEAVKRIHFDGAHYRTDIGEKALRRG
ncbi:MAG TPA: phosphoribosylamine--glycine ligase [Candidatus Hydrogenedentes bacterium]|nr:phosphoribosylamine--glycine ligase [Candidatus Hydrogenedentota bacterium]